MHVLYIFSVVLLFPFVTLNPSPWRGFEAHGSTLLVLGSMCHSFSMHEGFFGLVGLGVGVGKDLKITTFFMTPRIWLMFFEFFSFMLLDCGGWLQTYYPWSSKSICLLAFYCSLWRGLRDMVKIWSVQPKVIFYKCPHIMVKVWSVWPKVISRFLDDLMFVNSIMVIIRMAGCS